MGRPTVRDPLVPLPLRLPTSTVARLRTQAEAAGVTLSDVLRAHLTVDEAKPLAKPRPRRRPPKKLGSVSGSDPSLLRQLAAIGNNVNQIARAVNAGMVTGSSVDGIQLLAVLNIIECELRRIGA